MREPLPLTPRRARRVALACALLLACGVSPADDTPPAPDLAPLAAGRDFQALNAQLAAWIDAALTTNPSLEAARAEWRARTARVDQARAWPDPTAAYRYFGGSPETRVGPQVQSLELSQRVPWTGKRSAQARRAELEAAGAAAGVHDMERALIAELKRMYYEAAYVQEALAVNEEETELLRRFEQFALTRYSTGQGIQQSVIKLQTQISRLGDEAIPLRERTSHLSHGIARLLGDPDRPLQLDHVDLPLLEVDLSDARGAHLDMSDHTRTRAVRQRIEADRALERRRQLDGKPDLAFGFGYIEVGKREDAAGVLSPPPDNGSDIWSVGVQLSIPLYRRKIHAGVVEAQELVRANERRLDDVENGLNHEIHGALLRVETLAGRARLHRDVIIPQARESLASAEAAYTTGGLGVLDLLDAERVLFQARLTSHRLLTDYWIALADLEFALGRRFPDADAPGEPRHD